MSNGWYRVKTKRGDQDIPVAVAERIFRMMSESCPMSKVIRTVSLPRYVVNQVYFGLLRDMKQRGLMTNCGLISDQVIGHAYGSGVGPNNDYLLPREGSEEAQRIDAERMAVGA